MELKLKKINTFLKLPIQTQVVPEQAFRTGQHDACLQHEELTKLDSLWHQWKQMDNLSSERAQLQAGLDHFRSHMQARMLR